MRHVFALLAPSIVCGVSSDGFTVHFGRSGERPMSLQWVSPEGAHVSQGALPTQVRTYPGHHFIVSDEELVGVSREVSIQRSGDVTCQAVEGKLQCSGTAIDEAVFQPDQDDESAQAFYMPRDVKIDVTYAGSQAARLSWVDPRDGSQRFISEISNAAGMISQKTQTGHSFEVTGPGFQPVRIKILNAGAVHIAADGSASGSALEDIPAIYQGPRWKGIVKAYREKCTDVWKAHPADKKYFCDPMHDYRTLNTAKYDHPSDDDFKKWMKPKDDHAAERVKMQAQKFQNFTKVGFKVVKIPTALHQKLLDFYHKHKYEAIPEPNIDYDNAGLEGRTADTWLLDLSQELRQEAFDWVRDMVAKWANTPAAGLRSTALYGLRSYHRDAVLGVHVDIEATHALSAILEIARNDPEDIEPWPLEILDHSGKLHRVPCKAGQLILYESATCGHGRSIPFPGRSMVNAFVHFAPDGWPAKYLSSAPAATSKGYRSDKSEL
eukprot:TRINITY_DN18366_c0_g1_i1.p1 TRINITY_DN18366_c0_g1~~TRINITY_DN18366_c0_g1_i1.p1  ORF type:complete len:493 (+),score=40.60 TRINITY_DN18366_c0_g1_i1:125-1603(+)